MGGGIGGAITPVSIQLPGLGFFNNSPNGWQDVSFGPRLALFLTSGAVSVPLSADQTVGVGPTALPGGPLVSPGDAVWIEDVWSLYKPADNSGSLQLFSGRINLSGSGPNEGYDLGVFALTLATPRNPTIVERDGQKLITMKDLFNIGAYTFGTDTAPSLTANVNIKNNDGAGAHSLTLQCTIIFRIIHGLYE